MGWLLPPPKMPPKESKPQLKGPLNLWPQHGGGIQKGGRTSYGRTRQLLSARLVEFPTQPYCRGVLVSFGAVTL